MKNMRNIVFIVLLTVICSCDNYAKESTKQIEKKETSENVAIKETSISKSELLKLIELNPKWFNSWEWEVSNIQRDNFIQAWEKNIDLTWVEFDLNDSYLSTFKPYFINNEFGSSIDMYSYNTVLEGDGSGNMTASFNIDIKVYLMDYEKDARAEVTHSGSYEVIEDISWLSANEFFMLGYIDEEKKTPFLWAVNIKKKKQVFYQYREGFKLQSRENFFFIKYPKILSVEE